MSCTLEAKLILDGSSEPFNFTCQVQYIEAAFVSNNEPGSKIYAEVNVIKGTAILVSIYFNTAGLITGYDANPDSAFAQVFNVTPTSLSLVSVLPGATYNISFSEFVFGKSINMTVMGVPINQLVNSATVGECNSTLVSCDKPTLCINAFIDNLIYKDIATASFNVGTCEVFKHCGFGK